MNAHNNNKTFVCTNCNKALLTNSELKRHQDREAGNHKFKCEVCQVGFEEKRELHDYMDRHSLDKTHSCPDCRKTFRYKNNLYRHSRLHEVAKTEHRCDVCDEKFSQVRYLREHMQLHSNDRIECTKCDINIFDNNSVIVFIYDRFIILQVFIVYYWRQQLGVCWCFVCLWCSLCFFFTHI